MTTNRIHSAMLNPSSHVFPHKTKSPAILLLSALLSFSLYAKDGDLQIVRSDAQTTIVDFKLQDLRFDTLNSSSLEQMIVPRFRFGLSGEQLGAPDLPARSFILGIPAGAQVQVEIVPVKSEEFQNLKIAPVPEKQVDEDLYRFVYKPDERVFGADEFFPSELASLGEPARFRQQHIVRVEIAPVQYNPVQRILRIHREMRVIVRHIGSSGAEVAPQPDSNLEESFYRELILNYGTAKKLRVVSSAPLKKPGAVQAAGPLYKFALRQEGLYRITGQTLSSRGISLDQVQPNEIRLYNNGGRELPRDINASRPEGLIENAIYVSDGGDGSFGPNDFILFYGKGVDGFDFDSTGAGKHYLNRFGFDNYYWLSVTRMPEAGPAKRMATRPPLSPGSASVTATTFRDYLFVEEELNVVHESDQSWFGFLFTTAGGSKSRRYRVQLTDPATDSKARMEFFFYAPPLGAPHLIDYVINDQELGQSTIFGNEARVQQFPVTSSAGLRNGENTIVLNYSGSGEGAKVYVDYFELSYERQLRMPGSLLLFNGQTTQDPVEYRIENFNSNGFWLFEVTDFSNVVLLGTENRQVSGSQLSFTDLGRAAVPRRYLAVNGSAFTDVTTITEDKASSLRSQANAANMIVIAHEDFLAQAQRIETLREGPTQSFPQPFRVEVVEVQDVFDEFSAGMYDPVAVRDFLKYAYENWQRPAPQFVLLFGDGDYDPKNLVNKTDKNWIPSYHTADLIEINGRVTDSWFTYIQGNDAVMDLAIGRVPARTVEEAKSFVDKLVKYEADPIFGAWRNTVIMVADDENQAGGQPRSIESIHINDTETLVNTRTPDFFDIKKMYLTEYPAVQSASISGISKPTATEAFLHMVNTGALMVNYAGHGNPSVWSHERLLEISRDLGRIQNGDRQAVWVAATCTWGKFDMPDRQSFGEEMLLATGRGAVAVLATTRDVYATANANLNQNYYGFLFAAGRVSETLGWAMVYARASTRNTINDEKFHLYGDPAMRLATPRYGAVVNAPDTLKALSIATISGVLSREGVEWSDFNGKVRVEVFDSERHVNYRSPGQFSINYNMPGNSLFRGEAPAQNGRFSLQFIVSKDITYGGRESRVSVYFTNDSTDGNGYQDGIAIGGTAGGFVDQEGPEVKIGFQGQEDFVTGGYVGLDPTLHVTLRDSISGINLAGEIGHKITVTIDGDSEDKIDVTDLFNYDANSYRNGSLFYPFQGLAEGRHTVEVKAWDNSNNSGTAAVEFVIAAQDRLVLDKVMNYPNPFQNETAFTFEINHPEAEVRVKIYTVSGRLLRTLRHHGSTPGFNMIPWDGRDQDGDQLANGVYLFKLIASISGGDALQAEEIGKVVVQR